MMEFNGIQQVQQRISEIQKRFGIVQPPISNGQSFQQELNSELQKVSKEPAAVGSGREAARQQAGSMPGTAAAAVSVPAAQPTDDESLMIQSAATKYGVDPKLVSAVAEAESGGNQSAVSDAGAIGVMQLMPETAAALGVNPYDEQQNIEGGAKYLKQMLDSFGGDVKKAVAAYNAGAQAVRDYQGVPPYRETQNYVNKVLDLYQ